MQDTLRRKPGKNIGLFGGGELFRSLLAAGLVDLVEVSLIPVLRGGGIPLLPSPPGRAKLSLRHHFLSRARGIVPAFICTNLFIASSFP